MCNAETELGFLIQLDSICEEFESLFRQGRSPRIEDFVAGVQIDRRARLVHELVALEVALTVARGNDVSVDDVVSRYAPLLPPDQDRAAALRTTVEKALAATAEADRAFTKTAAWQGGPRTASSFPSVDGFEIQTVLGKGGMGIVYQAIQTSLNRPVALKMILDDTDVSDEFLERFDEEAKAVAELNDPHFVQIYAFGQSQGRPYMVLEFVDGESLEQFRRGEPQSVTFCATTVEHLARGMQKAHEAGLVHRDLKPHNVLLNRDGTPKITDFGLVKRRKGTSLKTRQGTIMGTVCYMAPEQAYGASDVGPAADVHALGGILYCLLTGRPPFLAATQEDTIMQVRNDDPVSPSRLRQGIPKDLETICLKCLQKDSEKRYETAEALAEDLRRFRAGEPIKARPVGAIERAWRWCRRNPRVALLGTAASVLATTLMIGGPLAAMVIYEQKGIADAERQNAQANERIAIGQGQLALETQKTLIDEVQNELKNHPRLQPLRRRLLQTALKDVEQIVTRGVVTREKSVLTASAYRRMGDIYLELGQSENALREYQSCHAIVTQLARDQLLPNFYHNLSLSLSNLGEACWRAGNSLQAKDYFTEALALRRNWVQAEPTDRSASESLAESLGKLGSVCLKLGRFSDAREFYLESFRLREQLLVHNADDTHAEAELAGTFFAMGRICLRLGDLAEAAQYAEKAIETMAGLIRREPDQRSHRANLAIFRNLLGTIRLYAEQAGLSVTDYTEAILLLQESSDADPADAFLRRHLAHAHYGIARAHALSNSTASRKHDEISLQLRRKLVAGDPKSPTERTGLMLSLARCGQHEEASQMAQSLLADQPTDASVLYSVATGFAVCAATVEQGMSDIAADKAASLADQYRQAAITTLKSAVKHGYQVTPEMRLDPDLKSLRDLADFQELLQPREPTSR